MGGGNSKSKATQVRQVTSQQSLPPRNHPPLPEQYALPTQIQSQLPQRQAQPSQKYPQFAHDSIKKQEMPYVNPDTSSQISNLMGTTNSSLRQPQFIQAERKNEFPYEEQVKQDEGENVNYEIELYYQLLQMLEKPGNNRENYNENENSILKTAEIRKSVPKNYQIKIEDNPIQRNSFVATFKGKQGSLYHEGAVYPLEILIHENHPQYPPFLRFKGVIPYHCNISDIGKIEIDELIKWNQSSSIENLLVKISELLEQPNESSPISINFVNTDEGKSKCKKQAELASKNDLKTIFVK